MAKATLLSNQATTLGGLMVMTGVLAASACGGDGSTADGGGGTGGSAAAGGSVGAGGVSSGGSPGSGGSGGSGGAITSSGGGEAGAAADSGGTSGGGAGGSGGSGGTTGDDLDVFGITRLYPSAPGGAEWSSGHWDEGSAYSITGMDDNDPTGLSTLRGTGTLQVTGTGELVMGGPQPRIYVYPDEEHVWQDIEVTVYYQRVEDEGTAYAGLVVGVRSGPDGHNTDTACDAHTYYARLRHDGAIDFEKELKHPASSTQSRIDKEDVWPPDGVLPTGQWIGWKFVIYNLGSSGVQLESYRDLTLGQDGGDWELMNETIDDGGWFVETDCAEHDPDGGESDLIVTDGGAILVRNTDITEARYRWLTIREILPP